MKTKGNGYVSRRSLLFLPLILVVTTLLSASSCSPGPGGGGGSIGLTPEPGNHTFTVAWQPPGLANVNIKVTPIVPPTQLDTYPSSYLDVTASFQGKIILDTDDPYYQCFEALAVE